MSDWSKVEWKDIPGMSMSDAKRSVEAGGVLISDAETFNAVRDMHIELHDEGFSDEEIAVRVYEFLAARKRRAH